MHSWTREELLARTSPSGECLIWQGSVGGMGYGTVRHDGRYTTTHRLQWRLSYGEIPNGLFVMHRCDVKLCINPKHLMLGTNADNLRDASAKGRIPHGETRKNSVLTERAVRAMQLQYALGGISLEKVGRIYGVCFSVARRIIRHETWRHVA